MKKIAFYFIFFFLFISTIAFANPIFIIVPSNPSLILIAPETKTYISYTVTNNTNKLITDMSINPGYNTTNINMNIGITNNQCSTLAPHATCSFLITLQASSVLEQLQLMPRVCGYNGTICSVPILENRVPVTVKNFPSSQFPLPYAGTFYPIYNSGPNQWIVPTTNMPFFKVSAIFIAFAHAYLQGNGAILTYEHGQDNQAGRIALLSRVARSVNPSIKILISLGWGKNDWTYINQDYINHANIFVPSVVKFIRENKLDGLDIDNEDIGDASGNITQTNFDGVIANLRHALNVASLQDKKPYYLTISPAGNNQPGGVVDTQVSSINAISFDLINIQTYYNGSETWGADFLQGLLKINYSKKQIANGIDTEKCNAIIPPYAGMAGLFNWTMSSDSACNNFEFTKKIAALVGYH